MVVQKRVVMWMLLIFSSCTPAFLYWRLTQGKIFKKRLEDWILSPITELEWVGGGY